MADRAEPSFLQFLKANISKGIVSMFQFSLKKDIELIDSYANVPIEPIPIYMHIFHKPQLEDTFSSHFKLTIRVGFSIPIFHLFQPLVQFLQATTVMGLRNTYFEGLNQLKSSSTVAKMYLSIDFLYI